MHIVYVSDGKAGHRSQALGLFKALQRKYEKEVSFEEVKIEDLSIFTLLQARFNKTFSKQSELFSEQPDYIFGVGSHTQLRVLLLGKIYPKAKTVILMKPNYPYSWFNHVVIPQHDGVPESGNIILTQGALNPIVNENRHQKNRILIALGGSSKRHQWNTEKVLTSLRQIVELNPNSELILTTSRRTPAKFLNELKQQEFSLRLNIYPVEETPQGWIFEEMQQAEAVWVTEDSISMIFEALTAGCRVGVIEIDQLKVDRITKSIDFVLQSRLISASKSMIDLPQAQTFKEADRVATCLLAQ